MQQPGESTGDYKKFLAFVESGFFSPLDYIEKTDDDVAQGVELAYSQSWSARRDHLLADRRAHLSNVLAINVQTRMDDMAATLADSAKLVSQRVKEAGAAADQKDVKLLMEILKTLGQISKQEKAGPSINVIGQINQGGGKAELAPNWYAPSKIE